MELPKSNFEKIIDEMKEARGIKLDTEFNADDMKEMAAKFKAYYKQEKGEEFPSDPKVQLMEAVKEFVNIGQLCRVSVALMKISSDFKAVEDARQHLQSQPPTTAGRS